jgi:hypothetical protein
MQNFSPMNTTLSTGQPVRNLSNLRVCAALGLLALLAGCEIQVDAPQPKPPPEIRVPQAQKAVVGVGDKDKAEREQQKNDSEHQPSRAARAEPQKRPDRIAARNSQPNRADVEESKFTFNVHDAVERIAAEIRDALSLRKTLVVLLVDQNRQAESLADRVAQQFSPVIRQLCSTSDGRFEMTVVGYGSETNLITPTPSSDADRLEEALNAAKKTSGDAVHLFAVVNEAIEKFLPYQSRGYEVIFVVAGTSSGDDLKLADQAIVALKRAAVPVYGIGPAMSFGGPRSTAKNNRQSPNDRPTESLSPERLRLALSGNQNTADLVDSGYGPFGLERLCRMTHGKFFRLRNSEPPSWTTDSSARDIKPDMLTKYAPDYVDLAGYQRLLAENKCRQALHDAALLPPTAGLESVKTDFPKQKDEAATAKMITNAQKAAAIDDQPIQKLYDALIAGEADRPKLTGARWQAGYDLALGQTLAAKARLDGYNAMLALLKQGKTFTKPESTTWMLVPADEIAAGSVLDKMAKKSRIYLQHVVDEHPGTPWAEVAKRELRYPAGWKLEEK